MVAKTKPSFIKYPEFAKCFVQNSGQNSTCGYINKWGKIMEHTDN